MATPVLMPKVGISVESCVLTQWHKKPGDAVKAGELLFTYETDKSTNEEEAKLDGILLEVFFEEGDDIPVLTNVAVIGDAGEDTAPYRPADQNTATEPTPAAAPVQAAPAAEPKLAQPIPLPANEDGRVKISPRARRLGQQSGVDPAAAEATGPNGRIIERDVVRLLQDGPAQQDAPAAAAPVAAPAAKPAYTDVKLPNIRKTIAKAMMHSLQSTAQLTMHSTFDATGLLAYRAMLKKNGETAGLGNITLTDMIVYAVARTLPNYPDLNAHLLDGVVRQFAHAHVGLAVDTPRGLLVPTLFDADLKSLNAISGELKTLAGAAQQGSIDPALLAGASFTVSNLGSFGIEGFTPVLNPPQVGILGVGTITERPRTVNGQLTAYPAMAISLTFDHQAIDGAPAARFMQELTRNLEQFALLLAK